jgi:hypothetical protein
MAGKNRALLTRVTATLDEAKARKSQRPCIFLSHISIDKQTAISIGDYIMEKGDIDIYLDVYDEKLQQAVKAENSIMITEYIEKGLEQSTHIMCIVSKSTAQSWWVPYELGFGKRAYKELSALALKEAEYLPQYLSIGVIIRGTKSLNEYLKKVANSSSLTGKSFHSLYENLIPHYKQYHPLDRYLNWEK